jgi:hypothetical protein
MTFTRLARADVPAACERLRALIGACDADTVVVVCDVGGVVADLVAVEVLARLRLTAQRLGCGLRLRHASRGLEQMLAFCGLCDVLPVAGSTKRYPVARAPARRAGTAAPCRGRR